MKTRPIFRYLASKLVLALVPIVALAQIDNGPTSVGLPSDNEADDREVALVADASQAAVLEAQANNKAYLDREVIYFAKRHRFVTMNDVDLSRAKTVVLQLFDDVSISAERRQYYRTPGMDVWEGVIVDPFRAAQLFEHPSGKPMDEESARQLLESQHKITIYAHLLPSIETGPQTTKRAIQIGVHVPALNNATYVVESLKEDPLVHVVYELDKDKCCFATLDSAIDPNTLEGARALEKGRAYRQYLQELDAEEKNHDDTEDEQ
ncbi:MAG: hypothetical protein OEW64_02555 [Gammaproteobacteria bacterium]|nr:hypothetical protein [Gammaproteobacteria bacterium]MDH5302960.1 hypothetical protein [Gammaproteobacteria bacterium]MDH5321126.1 hypothetical protein [Gammaproteobacteria bacterium]